MSLPKRLSELLLSGAAFFALGWLAHALGWLPDFPGIVPTDRRPISGFSANADAERRADDQSHVVALGRLEPAGHIIEVNAVPGQRIESLLVEENQRVEKGQELARLDTYALRRIELESIDSQLIEARARRAAEERVGDARIAAGQLAVEQAHAQDLEIAAQRKRIAFLRATQALAGHDLGRVQGLATRLVSDQEREHQELLLEKAESELTAADSLLEKLVRMSEIGVKVAEAELAAAEANKDQMLSAIPLDSLAKSRELAREQFKRTIVVAPCGGTILKVFTKSGESIGPRPIVQIGDLDHMVAVAEVYETELKSIREGEAAVISSPAFPAPYDKQGLRGVVERIGKVVMTPELKSLDPMARMDRHVVEVVVALDPEGSRQTASLSNLQVDVSFSSGS